MKIRKLIVISPLGLLLLLALAAVWWFLGDDAWVKGKIEDTVSEMTGRSLSIDGDFDLDWSSNPVLTAENIHFSNPPWAVNKDLARLDNLELSVDLFSVFKDQIKVHYIVANGLVVALEEHESGEKSWENLFGQDEPEVTVEEPLTELPVNVGRISLTGFSLLHEAPGRTVPLDFHLEELELIHGVDRHIQFVTDGGLGDEPFDMEGNFGPLDELIVGGQTSHDIRLAIGETVLQSAGSIEQLSRFSGANIKLFFSGPEFEWLLTQLALPQFSHGEFDFRLDVQTEGERTRLDLDGDLGSLHASARADFEDPAASGPANLTADISGDDLGGLLEVFGVSGALRNPFGLKADIGHAAGLYHIQNLVLENTGNSISVSGQMGDWPNLADTELDISVSGTDLQVWGSVLPTGSLPGGMLPQTEFDLTSRIVHTPSQPISTDTLLRLGNSQIQLSGSLGELPSMAGADLTVAVDGPVDGALVRMLGIPDVPGRDLSLKAKIKRDASYIYLNQVSMELAGNDFELSGKIGNWPELEGTDLTFSLDGPDLSIWSSLLKMDDLPASAFSLHGEILPTTTGLALEAVRFELADSTLVVNGIMGEPPEFAGTKLQTLVTVPDLASLGPLLGVEGLPAERLSVNGSFQRLADGWAFQLSNGSFVGAAFESDGKYIDTNDRHIIEATSQLTAPDLARLARLAGIENLPGQPVEIKGFARYEPGKVELRALEGRIGDNQFKVTATVTNPPSWSGSDVTLAISGPDIGQLLINRNIEDTLPFSLDGKIARMDQEIQIKQVKARLGSMQASVDGKLDNTSAADLQITISAPSLQPIGELLDFSLPDQPLRLSTTLQGSPEAFRAEQLKIELGASDLSGEMSVDLEGKPRISAVMKSNYLDLAWLQKADKGEDNTGQPTEKSKQTYLIPDSPILLPRIDFADSDIELTINKIDFPNRISRDIHIRSRVTDGNLYLDPFQVRGEDGGLLSGNLAVEREADSGITTLKLELQGDGVQLGIGSFEGQDPATIRKSDIVADLRGAGVTYHDLAGSLNGHIEVVQGAGLTVDAGLGLIFGNFIGEVLNLVNPFAETEKFTVNECSVAVVNIESGMVTVAPVVLQTDKMTIVAKGEVDLHTERILFTFNTKLRKGIGISASMVVNPFVSVTGTLQKPVVGLDPAAVVVEGTVAVATVGISLLVKSLADRYLSSKDPCGDALKKSQEQLRSSGKKKNK